MYRFTATARPCGKNDRRSRKLSHLKSLEILMRRVLVALFVFASMPALAAAAPDADQAKAIVEKGIKAQGGADKLAKLKAGRLKAKGKGDFPMIGEQEFT